MKDTLTALIFSTLAIAPLTFAQISPLDGEFGDSYYFVDHYEVDVNRPVSEVWPAVVHLGSWLPGLAEANERSPVAVEGEIFRLYGDFFMEVIKVIPESFLVMLNLPNSQGGEQTQGVAMLSLRDKGGRTVVSLFMSRFFFWPEQSQNSLRTRRESAEFSEERRKNYRTILNTLKEIAEAE